MSPFLAWGDFHARSRFTRSTIPEEKWGTTRSLPVPWTGLMATRRFVDSLLLLRFVLSLCEQSGVVPAGLFNFLASVEDLLSDSDWILAIAN